jgi:alkylhydroperoxidase family enzyme
MLAFLEKMAGAPGALGAADAAALRAAGLGDDEIEDALHAAYLFHIYDRCADAMGWDPADDARYRAGARHLLRRGYEPGAPAQTAAEARRATERAVRDGPGVTAPALRRAAFAGRDVPAPFAALVAKTHAHAYEVTGEEVAALRATCSDDELFEVIVAAAVGAAAARLDAAHAALAGEPLRAAARDTGSP